MTILRRPRTPGCGEFRGLLGLLELLAGHKKGLTLRGRDPGLVGRRPGPRGHLGEEFFGAPQRRQGPMQHIAAPRARARARAGRTSHFGGEIFGRSERSAGANASHRSASGACAREGSALEPILGRTSSAAANVGRGQHLGRAREDVVREPTFVGISSSLLNVRGRSRQHRTVYARANDLRELIERWARAYHPAGCSQRDWSRTRCSWSTNEAS